MEITPKSLQRSKRAQKLTTRYKERLRSDLVKRWGVERLDSINKHIANIGDSLYNQGKSYLTALEQVSQNVIENNTEPPVLEPPEIPQYNENFPIEEQKPTFNWAEAAVRKSELDKLEIIQERLAEMEKRRIYKQELEEQKRLVKLREELRKQQEKAMENELLLGQSQYLKAKIQKSSPYRYPHLLDSTLASKIGYAQSQRNAIERDKAKIAEEIDKTVQSLQKDKDTQNRRSHFVSSALRRLCTNSLTPAVGRINYTPYVGMTPSFARAPYSKAESFRCIQETKFPEIFAKLDIPLHQTRRHFKCDGGINHTNMWEYDPKPYIKAAGLPARVPAFNIINGTSKYINRSFDSSMSQRESNRMPFLQDRETTAIYHKNRAHNQSSSIFYY